MEASMELLTWQKIGITVVSHNKNKGYGVAQKTGYKEALNIGEAENEMKSHLERYNIAVKPSIRKNPSEPADSLPRF